MLDRPEPLFFAPFVSSIMTVEPQWIDYNGHLNMAYYNVLFDRAVDEVYEQIGIGLDYLKTTHHSTFTAEAHVRYLREIHEGDPVRVTFQVLGVDAKRIHYFMEMHHAAKGYLAATSEQVLVHVDLATRRSCPFPAEHQALFARMMAGHGKLPQPAQAGRSIGLAKKG